ncbi:MAG: VOC family protein [Acuticoccus sp.]
MEQRLSLITLATRDLERSTRFFEALGWQRSVKDAPGCAFYQCGSLAIGLYPRENLFGDLGIADDGSAVGGITIGYNTRTREEVDAVLDKVAALGAEVLKPGHEIFWGGYVGFFRDLDGHVWEVAWNPGFPITEDGAVVLPD